MLICLPDVLTMDEVSYCRTVMNRAPWQDGRATAGAQSSAVKNNLQMPAETAEAQELGKLILRSLGTNALFLSAALPKVILPPMFNRYGPGQRFGTHVDNALRVIPQTGERIRTDMSMTLFLCNPEDYESGELVIETSYGAQEVKLPAGHMVLYPSTSLHHVTPVTKGERVCAFFWLQSMIREEGPRTMLFDLDKTVQELQAERGPTDPATVRLAGIYHNLIRHWAEI